MKKLHVRMVLVLVGIVSLAFCVSLHSNHPAYQHSLSDLRAARWMIEHRPGGWDLVWDEAEAVRQIDAAINEIKESAADDGKNIDSYPAVDARPDHAGRLQQALDLLNKAYTDINQEEINLFAKESRDRANGHIEAAIQATRNALNDNFPGT
jgi:tetratricopeptide (TPR) repeat protein